MKASSYLIESDNEIHRLNLQSKIKAYNLEEELLFFPFDASDHVLDAGAGSGHLIKKLLDRNIQKIDALDFSIDRLREIKNNFKSIKEVKLIQADVSNTQLPPDTYDKIIARYLFEHLVEPEKTIIEMKRLLKPDGQFYIINFDNPFFGMETKNEALNEKLIYIRDQFPQDFLIGRKIPRLLKKHGFSDIKWEAKTYFFKDDELRLEKQNAKMRLEQARLPLTNILGSDKDFIQFAKEYLEEFDDECNVIYSTKFLIKARK